MRSVTISQGPSDTAAPERGRLATERWGCRRIVLGGDARGNSGDGELQGKGRAGEGREGTPGEAVWQHPQRWDGDGDRNRDWDGRGASAEAAGAV